MGLSAHGVEIGYGARTLVRDVDLHIAPGRTVGVTGPSGVGKTTLARAMAGLLQPRAGRVEVDGRPVSTRRGAMQGQVAMLFQSPRRSTSGRQRLWQIIAEPLRYRGRTDPERVRQLGAEVGLTEDLLTRTPGEVSDGQLQRAALARALAGEPEYLICDEATAMLDAISTAALVTRIKDRASRGLGVLVISHHTELLAAWAEETWSMAAPRDSAGVATLVQVPSGGTAQ